MLFISDHILPSHETDVRPSLQADITLRHFLALYCQGLLLTLHKKSFYGLICCMGSLKCLSLFMLRSYLLIL